MYLLFDDFKTFYRRQFLRGITFGINDGFGKGIDCCFFISKHSK